MLCFTPTAFLELELVRSPKNTFMRLVTVRDIRTLIYIKRKKEFEHYVCIGFGEKSKKLYSDQEVAVGHYLIPQIDELIENLLGLATINNATISNNTILPQMEKSGKPAFDFLAALRSKRPAILI